MAINPSTNRIAKMKGYFDNKEHIFNNFTINLNNKNNFNEFLFYLSKQIKIAPDLPDYEIKQIKIKYETKYIEINEENYKNIREIILNGNEKLLFKAVGHEKQSQFTTSKRASIEPIHVDENNPINRNPVEVRRAGTPPKRAVCSPLRSNTKQIQQPETHEISTPITSRHVAPSPLRTRPSSPNVSARKNSIVRAPSPHTPMRPIRTKTPTKSVNRNSTCSITPGSTMKNRAIKIKKDLNSPNTKSSTSDPKINDNNIDNNNNENNDIDDDNIDKLDSSSEIDQNSNPFASLVEVASSSPVTQSSFDEENSHNSDKPNENNLTTSIPFQNLVSTQELNVELVNNSKVDHFDDHKDIIDHNDQNKDDFGSDDDVDDDDDEQEELQKSPYHDFTYDYDEAPDMGQNIWRDSMGCCLDEIRHFKSCDENDQDEHNPDDDVDVDDVDEENEHDHEHEHEEGELVSEIRKLNFGEDHENEHESDQLNEIHDKDHNDNEDGHNNDNNNNNDNEKLLSSSVFDETINSTTTPIRAPKQKSASTTKKRSTKSNTLSAETASSAAKKQRNSRASTSTLSYTPKAATPVFTKKTRSQSSQNIDSVSNTASTSSIVSENIESNHHNITTKHDSPDKIPSYARPRESTKTVHDTAPLKITSLQWQNSLRKADGQKRNDRNRPLTARERARQYDANMLRAMRQDTKGMMADGRPSLDTMTAQWEFMRDQFLGSNENLEWMMTAKQGGEKAYKHAQKKFQIAEDQYYKSLCDIDIIEGKIRLLSGSDALILKILQNISDCEDVLRINPLNAEKGEIVTKNQEQLNEYLKGDLRGLCCQDLESSLKQVAELTDLSKCSKKAKFILQHSYPNEITQLKERLKICNVASTESLSEMEKWGTRLKETSQYSIVMAQEDMEWMSDNSEDNIRALETMRSLIPTNISEISIPELIETVKSRNGLYTQELATELKSNKLLHWIVTHSQDIAQSNFLNGDHRQYFVNLEALDIIEMRALRMVLPDKFELDGDNKKAEWRERFISRLKQLVSQDREENVKGGWDPESSQRIMVKLPALKEELKRRNIYFYRTFSQLSNRLKQYEDKEALLEKKQKFLLKAEEEEKEHRMEYDTVLEETRDPAFKALYGVEKLNLAKESAKREWKQAESRRNELRADVNRVLKSINSNPVSKTQFISFMTEQEQLLGEEWRNNDVVIPINGVFDRTPEITRIERSSAKFASAEQEALSRKMELTNLSVNTQEINNDNLQSSSSSLLSSSQTQTLIDENGLSSETSPTNSSLINDNNVTINNTTNSTTNGIIPGRVSRRISVNPDMINTLNSMLSSVSKSESGIIIIKKDGLNSNDNNKKDQSSTSISSATAIPTPTKPIRSKNLKKLLEMNDNVKPPSHPLLGRGGGPAGGLSFLDQIKNAKKKPTNTEDS